MGRIPPRSYALCDDVDSLGEQLPTEPGMAGLPEHWRHYEWKMAAALLALLGLVGIWTSNAPLTGMTDVHSSIETVWGVLVALAVCAGLFPGIRRRTRIASIPVP